MTELRDTIGYCGLICGVCRATCDCRTNPKPEGADCHQRNCCIDKGIAGCWECEGFPCDQGFFASDNAWRGLCVASIGYVRSHGLDAFVELVVRKHGDRMDHEPYKHKSPFEALEILQSPLAGRDDRSQPDAAGQQAEPAGPGPDWCVAEGRWTVDPAGRLIGESEGSAYLYRAAEHADDVRVTATMQAVEGIEITVWICGSPERTELDGYTLAVSAEQAKLQRLGEDMVTDAAVTIQPGRDYVLSFERQGAALRGYLDGSDEPFIQWTDPDPLRGEGHRTLGFYIWDGILAVSDVKVHP